MKTDSTRWTRGLYDALENPGETITVPCEELESLARMSAEDRALARTPHPGLVTLWILSLVAIVWTAWFLG